MSGVLERPIGEVGLGVAKATHGHMKTTVTVLGALASLIGVLIAIVEDRNKDVKEKKALTASGQAKPVPAIFRSSNLTGIYLATALLGLGMFLYSTIFFFVHAVFKTLVGRVAFTTLVLGLVVIYIGVRMGTW